MGQLNFKKPFELHNFSEIVYCGMTRFRNTNLGVPEKFGEILHNFNTQEPF